MVRRIVAVWIVSGLILVPYCVYRLLYLAQPDEYALLIVLPLFWIFGFWGVAGPLVAAFRVHKLMRALDVAQDRRALREAFEQNEGREAIVDVIAIENRIPRFIARKLYDRVEERLKEELSREGPKGGPDGSPP